MNKPAESLLPAAQDLAARRPVWDALSEMYLDTDVALFRAHTAAQLASSPYSLEQLDAILLSEVNPVCKYNLALVAGEWAGFDLDSLQMRILERANSRFKFLRWLNPMERWMPVAGEWRATRELVELARGGLQGDVLSDALGPAASKSSQP
jgi:hypothetical protein